MLFFKGLTIDRPGRTGRRRLPHRHRIECLVDALPTLRIGNSDGADVPALVREQSDPGRRRGATGQHPRNGQ